jgi:hypothetical protein
LAGPSIRRNELLVFKGIRYLGATETTSTTGLPLERSNPLPRTSPYPAWTERLIAATPSSPSAITGAGVDIDDVAAKMLERGTPEKIQLEIHATALVLRKKKGEEILAKVPSAMITWASQTRESIVIFLDTCSSPPVGPTRASTPALLSPLPQILPCSCLSLLAAKGQRELHDACNNTSRLGCWI